MARELSVIYGTLTISNTSTAYLLERYRQRRDYGLTEIECDLLVTGTSAATFAANCATVEAVCRTPRQRLRVTLGASTLIDLNPAAGANTNTGFDAAPELTKAAGIEDTARSRRYKLRVTVATPADLAGQAGRRDASVEVAYSPSRRRIVTISGDYSALAGNDATAQYIAAIAAYGAAVIAALGGVYSLASETRTRNDTDKRITFARSFREIFLVESGAGADDPGVANQRLIVTRTDPAPGDAHAYGLAPSRLAVVEVTYEADVDHDVQPDLRAFWLATLRGHVIGQAIAQGGLGGVALMAESVSYDDVENRITARMTLQATTSGNLLQADITETVEVQSGKIATPTWTGVSHHYAVFPGPPRETLRRSITTVRAKPWGSVPDLGGKAAPAIPGRVPRVFTLMSQRWIAKPTVIGLVGRTIEIVTASWEEDWLRIEKDVSGSSGVETLAGEGTDSVGVVGDRTP